MNLFIMKRFIFLEKEFLLCLNVILKSILFADIAFQSSRTEVLKNVKNQETVIYDKVLLNEGKAYDKNNRKIYSYSERCVCF